MDLDRRKLLKIGAALGAGLVLRSTPTDKTQVEMQDDADEAEGLKMYESESKYLQKLYFKDGRLPKLEEEYKQRFTKLQQSAQPGVITSETFRNEFSERAKPVMAELDRLHMREYMRVNAKFLLKHTKDTTWIIEGEPASCRKCEDGRWDIRWVPKYPIKSYSLVLAYMYASRKERAIALQELASGKPDETVMSRISTKMNFHSDVEHSLFSDSKLIPTTWISSEVFEPASQHQERWNDPIFRPQINIRREKTVPTPKGNDKKGQKKR